MARPPIQNNFDGITSGDRVGVFFYLGCVSDGSKLKLLTDTHKTTKVYLQNGAPLPGKKHGNTHPAQKKADRFSKVANCGAVAPAHSGSAKLDTCSKGLQTVPETTTPHSRSVGDNRCDKFCLAHSLAKSAPVTPDRPWVQQKKHKRATSATKSWVPARQLCPEVKIAKAPCIIQGRSRKGPQYPMRD